MEKDASAHRVLIIGSPERLEVAWLTAEIARHRQVVSAATVAEACGQADIGWHPILLVPSTRNQFRADALAELRQHAPLAAILQVVGPWCEGETRSGQPLPGIRRIYWHHLVARLRATLPPASDLRLDWCWTPATWTADEQWLSRANLSTTCVPAEPERASVVIMASSRETETALRELFLSAGCEPRGVDLSGESENHSVRLVAVDFSGQGDQERQQVEALRRRYPKAALVVLANFPRPAEVAAWHALGVDGVVGKPFAAEDLLNWVATASAT